MATNGNYLREIQDTPYFNAFRQLYHRDDVTYEEIEGNMDVENFMKAFIAECYASNTDFPHNNASMWRQTTVDGRWHWIPKDMDFIFVNNSSWDMFKYMLGTSDPNDKEYEKANYESARTACKLYEKMMSFPEFRNRFIATYATYLGDFLRPDVCVPLISEMEEEIIDEIPYTFAAYENMSTLKKHKKGIDKLYNYVTTRPSFVYRQMADYFSLGDVIPVNISVEQSEEFEENNITVCNTPLCTGRFDGAWFTSFPLSLRSDAENAAWTMTVTHANGSESTFVYNTAKIQPTLASCTPGDSITFMATNVSVEDAIPTSSNGNSTIAAIYDTTGKRHQTLQKGINIVLYSDGKRRKLFNAK